MPARSQATASDRCPGEQWKDPQTHPRDCGSFAGAADQTVDSPLTPHQSPLTQPPFVSPTHIGTCDCPFRRSLPSKDCWCSIGNKRLSHAPTPPSD